MLPVQVRVLRILIGVQIYRLIGLILLGSSSTFASSFLIPTVTGDTLTAIFAPIIALLITMKHGPRIWLAAVTWNVLGLTDLVYAITLASLTNGGTIIQSTYPVVIVGSIVGIVLHVVSIAILLRGPTIEWIISRVQRS